MGRYSAVVAVVVTGVLVAPLCGTLPLAAQTPPPIISLLDRYAAGQQEEVVAAFAGIDNVDDARKDLENHGRAWAEAVDELPGINRRLLVATFALEFANARMSDEWVHLRSLIEWGCKLLREAPPVRGEATWHLASVAVGQRAADWDLLRARGDRSVRGFVSARWARDDHARHGRDRFPADPRLAFSEAQAEAAYVTPPWPRGASWERYFRTHDRIVLIDAALSDIEPFLVFPDLAPAAEFWTGMMLALGRGETDAGVRHLDAAFRSDDPFVASVAHHAAGRLAAADGHVADAIAHYQAALARMPRTQSASLSLAVLLFGTGRPDDAYVVTNAVFAGPPVDDPFRLYGFGNYRFFDDYLATLHAEIGL